MSKKLEFKAQRQNERYIVHIIRAFSLPDISKTFKTIEAARKFAKKKSTQTAGYRVELWSVYEVLETKEVELTI